MTAGDALRLIRRRNGLSPPGFAARLGVHADTVRRAEKRGSVSAELAAAVRRVFWFDPLTLADLSSCDDPLERERHLTYLRPLGAMP